MSSSEPFRFHSLPRDLARVVIETLADFHYGEALSCALVSKEVKVWVEPILYRNIRITTRAQLKALAHLVTDPNSTKPTNFFAIHVKSVFFGQARPIGEVRAILEACPGIQSLAIWDTEFNESSLPDLRDEVQTPTKSSPSQASLNPFPSLLQLSLPSLFFSEDRRHFSHPLFKKVTHLEPLDWHFIGSEWDWKTLDQLKYLTHLRCTPPTDRYQSLEKAIRYILDHCPPSLQVLIAWTNALGERGRGRGAAGAEEIKAIQRGDLDIRVILAFTERYSDFEGGLKEDSSVDYPVIICSDKHHRREWNGVEYNKSLWKKAEEIIEDRRRRLQVRP